MTEYLTDHEASLPAIMLGCVAEISQSVPASIGKGIPGQKADLNEAAGGRRPRARRPKGESAQCTYVGSCAGLFCMEADAPRR